MGAAPARLRQRREFLRVAHSGRKWVAPGLILQIGPHMDEATQDGTRGPAASIAADAFRVGFTVSRKVGGAVVRNRVRRRLRAAVEAVMPAHAAPGHDYVVIGRAATAHRPFDALRADLETGLRRLGAWCDDGGVDGRPAKRGRS